MISSGVKGPWLVCGDFNNPLSPKERIGSPVLWSEIEGFKHCVDSCGLFDIKSIGFYFTWNNKQDGASRVMCKLDRMMGNDAWMDLYGDSIANFLSKGLFDHSPAVLATSKLSGVKRKPFRYFNICSLVENFIELVKTSYVRCFL